MAKSSRYILGLCLDKERDEKLINMLNSKANKSDYIRRVLYEKLNDESNLTDSLISDKLLGVLNAALNSAQSKGSESAPNDTSVLRSNGDVIDSIPVEPDVNSEDDMCFQQAIASFGSLLSK